MKVTTFALLGLLLWPFLAAAQVTSSLDSGPGSLRVAVNSAPTNSTITFAPALSGATIILTTGEILLNKNLTLDASSLAGGLRINANDNSRIFEIASGATNVITGILITNGLAAFGGGILNNGNLTLNNCTIAGNTVGTGGNGGGIYQSQGRLTLNQCTVSGNLADLTNGQGGGIYLAGGGGALVLNQSTVSANAAAYGGGVAGGGVTIFNSILAGNTNGIGGDLASASLIALGNNITNGNPILAPLGKNGGAVPTMPPLFGSPAIDAGNDSATNSFSIDQRGIARFSGNHVDLGAVETQTYVITTAADSGPGSIRDLLSTAPAGSLLGFSPQLSGQTILLTNGQLSLANHVSIDASTLPGGITLNGGNTNRIFAVGIGVFLTLKCLTVAQGFMVDVGGGIFSLPKSRLQIIRCAFTGNSAPEGGAIMSEGDMFMDNSTLSGNSATYGGAIHCRGNTLLTQCTIAGNVAAYGAGVFSKQDILTLNDTIIFDNDASARANDVYSQLAAIVFTNANIIENIYLDRPTATNSGPDPILSSPQLAPFGNYGGPTPTMPPLPGSPAIDAGSDANVNGYPYDQRGFPRISGTHMDLGAVEMQVASTPFPLTSVRILDPGVASLAFTNLPGGIFTVIATTNASLPISTWSTLGYAAEVPPGSGSFQFNYPVVSGQPQRFYRVHSP